MLWVSSFVDLYTLDFLCGKYLSERLIYGKKNLHTEMGSKCLENTPMRF